METAQSLKDRAVEKTRLSDFGDDHSDDPLHAWAEDLANPRLNEVGRAVFLNQMVGDLSRRLRVIDCLKRNPAIDKVAVPPILYISGLERTGTTLLHNLLSLHPKARALLRWELMHPTPPPEAATYASDPRIAKAQASIDKLRGTLLESMHWVNANDPEECQWGMIDGSSIMGRSAVVSMPTWREWAARRDPIAGLREYRRVVKLLLWRNPPPAGGHLVLKCPQFLGDLGTLASVFPEARFVVTHRDPFRAIVSVCARRPRFTSPTSLMRASCARLRSFQMSLSRSLRAAFASSSNSAMAGPSSTSPIPSWFAIPLRL